MHPYGEGMPHPRRLVDAFWDLRDHARDHPDQWDGVTAEELLQQLAAFVEAVDPGGDAAEWRAVAEQMFAWRLDAAGS